MAGISPIANEMLETFIIAGRSLTDSVAGPCGDLETIGEGFSSAVVDEVVLRGQ